MVLQCSWRGRRSGGLFRGVDKQSPGATGCLAPVSVLTQAFATPAPSEGRRRVWPAVYRQRLLLYMCMEGVILADELIFAGAVALFTVDQAHGMSRILLGAHYLGIINIKVGPY